MRIEKVLMVYGVGHHSRKLVDLRQGFIKDYVCFSSSTILCKSIRISILVSNPLLTGKTVVAFNGENL